MRNIILTFFVSFFFLFAGTTLVHAESGGFFNCSFEIGSNKCIVTAHVQGCLSGFHADESVCAKYNNDIGTCRSVPDQPCVANASTNTNSDITCGTNGEGINTAIGCIPFGNSTALISFILSWALGIAGGIAFLLILVAGFQIMTSRGDPNRLKAGQELLTSAIAGLVLLIFSIFILRVIGVNILQIPGFSK